LHIVNVSTCEVCGTEGESIAHALIRCNHAKALREAMRQFWELPDEQQFSEIGPDRQPLAHLGCAGNRHGSTGFVATMESLASEE
jgi:hypothetical protein